MLAREAVLNDSEVARILRERFVCIAIDNVDHPQLTPDEREFLADKGLKFCTQGMSAFTAGGQVLAMGGGFEAKPVRQMLQTALENYRPEATVQLPAQQDRSKILAPPDGGLVMYVTWKVLDNAKPQASATTGDGQYDEEFRRAVGVDRLWVRADEAAALAQGEIVESLKRRMLPHFSYAMAGQIKQLPLTVEGDKISGTFTTDTGDAGHISGLVESQDGKVLKFHLLARGIGERIEDFGFAAGLTNVPKGKKVSVAMLIELAEPGDELAKIPPHRAGSESYLK